MCGEKLGFVIFRITPLNCLLTYVRYLFVRGDTDVGDESNEEHEDGDCLLL